jgi:23S rRNA (cytosine1962-C5)-methyltransferase
LNHAIIGRYVKGKEFLDCFSYNGGFAINALHSGAASLTCVESSERAIQQCRENLEKNGFDPDKVEFIQQDVFHVLRDFRDRGRQFDVVVLDPPKFAKTRAQVARAGRGYKDINLLAFKLLRDGGILITFSCSGGVGDELFQKFVSDAAVDAGVEGRLLEKLRQAGDHPVRLAFPEGAYLKGLVVSVEKKCAEI